MKDLLETSEIIEVDGQWFIISDGMDLTVHNTFSLVNDPLIFKGYSDALIYKNILLDNLDS